MYEKLWRLFSWRPMPFSAAALSCAAILYSAAGSVSCGPNDIIIHDECVDAGATDAGDAGAGGASSDPLCN